MYAPPGPQHGMRESWAGSPGVVRQAGSFAGAGGFTSRTLSPSRVSPRARSPVATDAGLDRQITAAVDALVRPDAIARHPRNSLTVSAPVSCVVTCSGLC